MLYVKNVYLNVWINHLDFKENWYVSIYIMKNKDKAASEWYFKWLEEELNHESIWLTQKQY